MFKVVAEPQFTHPVKVLVPVDGGHETQTFKATFRVLPSDQEDAGHDLNTTAGSSSFLRDVLLSMSELEGENGPIPYSDTLRDQLLKVPYVRTALARTYFDAVTKAALGN
ncbi:hypothetical protein [Sphingomonas melonis]|uniref:hypothetical protein n=1 Tax=Sphingomonas melonis TaxID=152682 RepID=UPI0035C7BE7D